jgi:hypothetical protein
VRGLPGPQLREHVDLGLAQPEVGKLAAEMVEDAVHRGLEGGDHGAICHEVGYYDLGLKYATTRR